MRVICNLSHNSSFLIVAIIASLQMACSDVKITEQIIPIKEKTFQVKISTFCPKQGSNFADTFAHNFSAPLEYDHHEPDSDADGLTDEYEKTSNLASVYNFRPEKADTNDDGYSDFLVNLLGRDVYSQGFFKTCNQKGQDTDQDGISDCEEDLVKTDPDDPDSDDDGLPDGIEVRFGTNALDPVDSFLDPDQDGFSNLEELKNNTPINYSNDLHIESKKYSYKVITKMEQNTECYEITISNIPHMDIEQNMVKVFVLENEQINTGGTGQGQQLFIRTATLLVPRDIADGDTIVIETVSNQTVNPEELVINSDEETTTQ